MHAAPVFFDGSVALCHAWLVCRECHEPAAQEVQEMKMHLASDSHNYGEGEVRSLEAIRSVRRQFFS